MPYPSKEHIFKTLITQSHRINEHATLFPELDPSANIDTEFWYYSDLYNLFGTPHFELDKMYEHTWNAFKNLSATSAALYNHVELCHHEYNIHNPNPPYKITKTMGSDAKLTRYACWAIFKQIPHLIFTQMFFMTQNPDYKTLYRESYKFARIYQRKKLRQSERILSGVLKNLDANIRLTQHEMSRTLFGGMVNDEIRTRYNIPNTPHKPLSDYMGVYSLYARRTAIDNTVSKFAHVEHKNLHAFNQILHAELLSARNAMLRNQRFTPEQDIYPSAPINKVESEYKKIERDFISKYSTEKIR
ncbi:MAG: hypothetical protein IJX43_03245 [Alphaproteobacteria bacterium]|nr:hypothetical protein [Alphaproteobacteria bacterium]